MKGSEKVSTTFCAQKVAKKLYNHRPSAMGFCDADADANDPEFQTFSLLFCRQEALDFTSPY
jgi:hypothetical protein